MIEEPLICIVSTIPNWNIQVVDFVKKNREAGADHFFLFDNAPQSKVTKTITSLSYVTVIPANMWKINIRSGLAIEEVKYINAQTAKSLLSNINEEVWFAHLDVEECIDVDKKALSDISKDVALIELEPLEWVHFKDEPTSSYTYAKKPYSNTELREALKTEAITPDRFNFWYIGHMRGKTLTRIGNRDMRRTYEDTKTKDNLYCSSKFRIRLDNVRSSKYIQSSIKENLFKDPNFWGQREPFSAVRRTVADKEEDAQIFRKIKSFCDRYIYWKKAEIKKALEAGCVTDQIPRNNKVTDIDSVFNFDREDIVNTHRHITLGSKNYAQASTGSLEAKDKDLNPLDRKIAARANRVKAWLQSNSAWQDAERAQQTKADFAALADLRETYPAHYVHGMIHFILDDYDIIFAPHKNDRIVAAFNYYLPSDNYEREPFWGLDYFLSRHHAFITVRPKFSCWYQKPVLAEFFKDLSAHPVFQRYTDRITYGGSMGGTGAIWHAANISARTVIAMNPQVSLEENMYSMHGEWRFTPARYQLWQPERIRHALEGVDRLIVSYDPMHKLDRQQVEKLRFFDGLIEMRVPFIGHGVPGFLAQTRELGRFFTAAIDENEESLPQKLRAIARRRRLHRRYFTSLLMHPRIRRSDTRMGIVSSYATAHDENRVGGYTADADWRKNFGEPEEAWKIALSLFPEHRMESPKVFERFLNVS